MTSEQRREARYQRRRAKRLARRKARSDALGSIDQVFSFRTMFLYGRKCCNGVRWKQSTQNFKRHLFSGTAKRRRQIINGTWKPGKPARFVINERGKVRVIDAPHINDRQIHKVLTKEVLVPLYAPSMIHDNGASQKGKGLHWHYKRLEEQLRWHYRRYGLQGSVFLMDFSKFFPSAPHALIYERHDRLIFDNRIRALADSIVAACGNEGMMLGVEPSQQEMVALPSDLDNYAKAQLAVHGMGHYMDDYQFILDPARRAQCLADGVIQRAEAQGLRVNRRKSAVQDIAKPFRFCKAKFQLTDTGRVTVHGCRDGMKRARRKLRYFKAQMEAGQITPEQARQKAANTLQSHAAYYQNFDDHGRVLKLRRLYYAMFLNNQEHGKREVKTYV